MNSRQIFFVMVSLLIPFHGTWEAKAEDHFSQKVLPILQRYCIDCHSQDQAEAKIALDHFETESSALQGGTLWLRVLDALEDRTMPPTDAPQPPADQVAKVMEWIKEDFLEVQCQTEAQSSPVVIRRLNRQEYNNTIRDLLNLDLQPADDFPQDEIGYGYDNVGSALSTSPLHLEKYLDAAEMVLQSAIVLPNVEDRPPTELIGLQTYPLLPNKAVEFDHHLAPGRYLADLSLVRVGIAESVRPPKLSVAFGQDHRMLDAVRIQDETVVYRFWISVAEGDKQVKVSLPTEEMVSTNVVNPQAVAANESGDQRYGNNRGLHVDSIVVRGPARLPESSLPDSHRRIFFRMPEMGEASSLHCANQVISKFAERAFRQPIDQDDLKPLLALFQLAWLRGESFERAIQVVLTKVLVSPKFLYLVEPEQPEWDSPLTEYELASRLSYFLWSSMPDDELMAAAKSGTLRTNLRPQVIRMLNDNKSDALVENFAGQWLQLRRLDGVSPDLDRFPSFDSELRWAMRTETQKFLAHVLRNNRSVLEMIDSDYTFLNAELARHYQLPEVTGNQFRQVTLSDRLRGGILTQASVLTLTSNPNRTSPVKRGQWILQQILGTPPPPPPPDVLPLDESSKAERTSTLRERLELHRANPQCASCHNQMDPLGFALENFDAIGRFRESDGEFPINPAGELQGGRKFANIQELKQLLKTTGSKKFTRCLIENMFVYSLGRGLQPSDFCTIEAINKQLAKNEYQIHAIVFGIVESKAFQTRGKVER